jgi:outer membrane protein assembly factor BamB
MTNEQSSRKPLRLWPGVAAATVQFVAALLLIAIPGAFGLGMLGVLIGGLLIVLWWLFFSRAPWMERLAAIAVMVAVAFVVHPLLHPSIAGAAMGMFGWILSVPAMAFGLAVWAATSRRLTAAPRGVALVAAVLLACATLTVVRTDGVSGDGGFNLRSRWSPTAEDRLLAQAPDDPPPLVPPVAAAAPSASPAAGSIAKESVAKPGEPAAPAAAAIAPATRVEWSGFRGPNRDSIVRGVRIETDWTKSPPVKLWQRPVGPGWSSFAVHGDVFFTQEQRGGDEIVGCYRVNTGEPVWRHKDPVRFYESNGGAGPRATPTIHDGRVYAFGATGILNALDERTGRVIWSRDVAKETEKEIPMWGFTSSPLVFDDVVIVAASGRMAGYEVATGKTRWLGPDGGGSYGSPHLATIDGVPQILLLSSTGTTSLAPASGAILWKHEWSEGTSIVQPALTAEGDVLVNTITAMGGVGLRRLTIVHEAGGWSAKERWTSPGLKPYFNDFVVHKGHAYGFDGTILASINLEDGKRMWKGGRYGAGQLVLLPEQDLLLVLSEEGDLALVSATPDKFAEVAKFKAIEGKTWNHPVLIGDVLLVRNGEEMAAFRLTLAGR